MDIIEGPDFIISNSEKELIEEFYKELLDMYPQMKDSVEENEGLLHCDMGDLCRMAEALCGNREIDEIRKCFEFVNRYFVRAKSDLLNAINVSFLEYFRYSPGLSDKEFRDLMPPTLYQGYKEMLRYMEELGRRAAEMDEAKGG